MEYNKLKAMEIISRYDIVKNWQLTFSDHFIEMIREEYDETKRITIVYLKGKCGIDFENLGCIRLNKLHELYQLAEELQDCKEV